MKRLTIATSGALVILVALACGPSIRRTYQSDNAFTRCFELDYNPKAATSDKQECWEHWLAGHLYNQPSDKPAYARLRLEELANGISIPGPPGPDGSFDKRPTPPVATSTDDQAAPLPASSTCESGCKTSFGPCVEGCRTNPQPGCREICDHVYGSCMQSCFRPTPATPAPLAPTTTDSTPPLIAPNAQ